MEPITNRQKIEQAVDKLREEPNVEILTAIKKVLDSSFGEANNQIIPPSLDESIDKILKDSGTSTDNEALREVSIRMMDLDVLERSISNLGYTVIVRFPETIIKNSKEQSLVIKDLFVRFILSHNGRITGKLEGARATITENEYFVGYRHSHLGRASEDNCEFSPFCLGSGEITQTLMMLRKRFNVIDFTLFCMHLKNYVAWESIEGVPYHHIDEVINGSKVNVYTLISQYAMPQVVASIVVAINDLPTHIIKSMFNYEITKWEVKVSATEDFEIWGAGWANTLNRNHVREFAYDTDFLKRLIVLKDSSGRYTYADDRIRRGSIRNRDKTVITFKGEVIKFKTIRDEQQEEKLKNRKACLNPSITSEVCKYYSRVFTRTAIQFDPKADRRTEDTSQNIREITEPDFVSVLQSASR